MQGRTEIQIKIPSIYEGLFPLAGQDVAIEHASVECKIKESLLADLFSEAVSCEWGTKEFLFVTRNINRMRTVLSNWMNLSGCQVRPRAKGWAIGQGTIIWIMSPNDIDLMDMPFIDKIERTVICDAHSISVELHGVLRNLSNNMVCEGWMTPRDHWFYSYARDPEITLHRFPIDDLLPTFPHLKVEVEKQKETFTREECLRYLDIEDIVTVRPNFTRFAKSRLWIKTDRKITDLSPEQRSVAENTEGTPIVPYILTPLNRRYLAMKRLALKQGRKPRFLLLKYRRGGFTTLEQGLSYAQCVNFPYSQCITLAHTQSSTQRIFRIAKLFQERDPRHLTLATDSKTSLEFAENGSAFFIGTAGGHGVSRGDTIQRAHGSEVSKWCPGPSQKENVEDIVAGLVGAASHGEVILETTPDGFEWFANTYQDAKKYLNDWVPLFLPWFIDPVNREHCVKEEILDTLTGEEKNFIEKVKRDWNMNISCEQIAFRRSKKREYGRLFRQEYPEDDVSCFIISGDPFFNIELIMNMLDMMPDYHKEHIPGGYKIRWKEPVEGRKYVCGCDTSEGLPSSDPNGFGVLDKESGEQVCAVHGRFSFDKLAELAVEECIYYNRALLGIERNNHGHAVLKRTMELGYKKPHNRGGPLYHFSEGRPGWDTNSATRPVMIDELAESIEKQFMIVNDKDFLSECLTFKKQSNNKYEADQGCHDDTVLKWAIAWQMRKVRRPVISFNTV